MNVAQLAEHWVVAPAVAGSSPVVHPFGIGGCGGMADAHDLGSCVFGRGGSSPLTRTREARSYS